MIIGRNKTLQSRSQFSVLKALLKWRDYVARVEDESTGYIMPNHVLFQLGKDMPTTVNELRDCCRANMSTLIMKYGDDLIKVIRDKIDRVKGKQINTHIKFDEVKRTNKAKEESSSSESSSSEEDDKDKEDVPMKEESKIDS
jgi:exosome complex exonuclease RRP6